MMKRGFPVVGSRILVMGLAFKENCPDIRNSKAPFVHQFVWGEMDGPVPFHYSGAGIAQELGLERAHA